MHSLIGCRNGQFSQTNALSKTTSNFPLDLPRGNSGAPKKPDMAGESLFPMPDTSLSTERIQRGIGTRHEVAHLSTFSLVTCANFAKDVRSISHILAALQEGLSFFLPNNQP
jgi:hypothetical protein